MEMGASTGMMQRLQLNKRLRLSHHTGDKKSLNTNPTESRAIPVSLGLGFYLSWIRRMRTSQVNNGLEGYYGVMNCHVTIGI